MTDITLPPELEELTGRLDLFFHSKGGHGDLTVSPDSKSTQLAELGEHHWFACHRPERPHESAHTSYHDCCRACLIAAQAAGFNVVPIMVWRLETFGEAGP